MKKSIMTVAAIAMVLSFTSCKETSAQTTEEKIDETAISIDTEEEVVEEEIETEVELDTTNQIDSLENTSTEATNSEKE